MTEICMKEIEDILVGTFLFSDVSPLTVEKQTPFFSECAFISYSVDTIIQSAEAPIIGIAVIADGTAGVFSDSSDDGILLRTLGKGQLFGAASLYTENNRYETVIRALSETRVLLIPEKTVKRLISSNSLLSENYIRFLSARICFLNQKISAFTAGSAEAKLAVYLSELPRDETGVISLAGSYSALADSLGMGRASLYRALDKLENNGTLRRDGKRLVILDETALSAMFRK